MFSSRHDADKESQLPSDPSDGTQNPIGEELSLDESVSVFDTSELVGSVTDAPPAATEAYFESDVSLAPDSASSASLGGTTMSGFDETVSLPTPPPASASAQSEETTAVEEVAPVDVLQNRATDPTVAVVGEETSVMRKSLISTPVQTEQLPSRRESFPQTSVQESFDDVVATDSTVLAGATVLPTVPSRAGARWLSLLLILLFTPITWYLLSDASARLAFATGNPMDTGIINPAALLELGGGLVFIILIGVVASQSSLGLLVSGIVVTLVGLPFLVIPDLTAEAILRYLSGLRDLNDFGANVFAHLNLTGFTGVLVIAGLTMIVFAAALASVRRAGRRDEATRVMVAATNPGGMNARWARKATSRATQGK